MATKKYSISTIESPRNFYSDSYNGLVQAIYKKRYPGYAIQKMNGYKYQLIESDTNTILCSPEMYMGYSYYNKNDLLSASVVFNTGKKVSANNNETPVYLIFNYEDITYLIVSYYHHGGYVSAFPQGDCNCYEIQTDIPVAEILKVKCIRNKTGIYKEPAKIFAVGWRSQAFELALQIVRDGGAADPMPADYSSLEGGVVYSREQLIKVGCRRQSIKRNNIKIPIIEEIMPGQYIFYPHNYEKFKEELDGSNRG